MMMMIFLFPPPSSTSFSFLLLPPPPFFSSFNFLFLFLCFLSLLHSLSSFLPLPLPSSSSFGSNLTGCVQGKRLSFGNSGHHSGSKNFQEGLGAHPGASSCTFHFPSVAATDTNSGSQLFSSEPDSRAESVSCKPVWEACACLCSDRLQCQSFQWQVHGNFLFWRPKHACITCTQSITHKKFMCMLYT